MVGYVAEFMTVSLGWAPKMELLGEKVSVIETYYFINIVRFLLKT
jgi:hypothetical protein